MSQQSSPSSGVFGRFIKGTGLTPTANALSFAVAFGGAAAWYWYDVTTREKAKLEFDKNEQQQWNQQVWARQRAEEAKKRLGGGSDVPTVAPSHK